MHAIFFATKRAFHGVLRVTRKPLESVGLTAARFDLMFALLQSDLQVRYPVHQSEMRRRLGVSAPVVSRMLGSLEAMGLVSRRRPEYGDKRQREIRLTDAGLQCIRAAHRMLTRAVRRLVHQAICFGKHRDKSARFLHIFGLDAYLRSMREHYGDAATLTYPLGHPDD
jgi:DNA-binding MarR family transcriptional regulator